MNLDEFSPKDIKNLEIYYTNMDTKALNNFKIRYLVYGIILFVATFMLFWLEFTNGYGVTVVLDKIVSLAMFFDMAYAAICFSKYFLTKSMIKADSIFLNMTNYTLYITPSKKLGCKKTFSILRFASIAAIILNISLLVLYFAAIYSGLAEASLHFVLSISLAIIVFITTIVAAISLDSEDSLYKDMIVKLKNSSNSN